MSAIFKDRKIPRRLVIKEEYELQDRPRSRLGIVLFWAVLLVGVIWLTASLQGGM